MAHNYPKWPKNDARIYALFPQIFLTEKAVPQTFSLLECMHMPFQCQDESRFLCPVYSAPFSPPNLLSVHLSPLYFLRIKKGFASSIFCNTRSNVIDLWQVNSSPQTFSEKVCKQKDLCGGEIKTGLCPYYCKTLSIQKQTQLSRDDGSLITD